LWTEKFTVEIRVGVGTLFYNFNSITKRFSFNIGKAKGTLNSYSSKFYSDSDPIHYFGLQHYGGVSSGISDITRRMKD